MRVNSSLTHLKQLCEDPYFAWNNIDSELYESKYQIIRKNYFPFFLSTIFVFAVKSFIEEPKLFNIIKKGAIYPIAILGVYLFITYTIAMISEKTLESVGGKSKPLASYKLTFFSGLPFLAFFFLSSILSAIPYIKYLSAPLIVTGLIYQSIVFYAGAEKLLFLSKEKKIYWFLIMFTALSILAGIVFFIAALIFLI
ncbi:MAG: hypothetical protein OEZ13_11135 [Spirochaetia bacterium]|nr:hypothetical protein [Spirochaetia bacterium]